MNSMVITSDPSGMVERAAPAGMIRERSYHSGVHESVLLKVSFVGHQLDRAASFAYLCQFHSQVRNEVGFVENAGNGIPARVILVHTSPRTKLPDTPRVRHL